MEIANRLKNVQEYYFSKKLREIEQLRQEGKKIISLAIGSPDLMPDLKVVEALHAEALKPNQHGYQSYQGHVILRRCFGDWYARHYGVRLDADREVLPLIGSKEGIVHLCFTYLNEGDEVLVPNPGYPTYRSAIELAGAKSVGYDLEEKNNWLPNFEAIEKRDLSKVKMMWVNYPHMPTGARASKKDFEEIVQFGKKHGILVCNDNPYSFIRSEERCSILSVEGAFEVAVELNSLSKSHNMAGWRVGVLVGKGEHISNVLRFKSNMDSGMFLPLQLAATEALKLGEEWYKGLNKVYGERERLVCEIADELGCVYMPQQVGLFLWARVPKRYKDGYELSDRLLYEAGVFVTPGGVFGSNGEGYIRISLCSDVKVLEEALERIKKMIL